MVGGAIIIALSDRVPGIALVGGLCTLMRICLAALSQLRVTASVAVICLLVVGLTGLLSSFIPAWGASRRPIIDSLKFSCCAQLQQAQGQLAELEARLLELQNGSGPEEPEVARANPERAKTDLASDRINLKRPERLRLGGFATKLRRRPRPL